MLGDAGLTDEDDVVGHQKNSLDGLCGEQSNAAVMLVPIADLQLPVNWLH